MDRQIKHSLIYLFARGVPGIINFLAIAVYTRLLPPEEYGQYILVVAWVGLCSSLLFQWLRLGLLRFLPSYEKENRSSFLSTILVAFLCIFLITVAIAILVATFWPKLELQGLLILSFLLLGVQAWYEINLELLRSELDPVRYGISSLAKATLALLIGWILAIRGFGASGLVIGLIVGFIMPSFWIARCKWQGISLVKFNPSILKRLLTYGLPLTATFALNFVVSSSDRIMIGWLKSTEEAGLYAVGYDLANQSLVMLMMIINLAAYPLALRVLEEKSISAAQEQLRRNCILLLAIAMPAATGLAILAPNIAKVLLGRSFADTAARVIPIISLAALVMGLKAYHFDLSFQLGQRTQGQMLVSLVTAMANLILNFWWIPISGLCGAAYATLCSYVLGLILSIRVGRNIFYIPFPTKVILQLSLITAGMAVVLCGIASWRGVVALIMQILIGVITYGILFVLFDIASSRKKLINCISNVFSKSIV